MPITPRIVVFLWIASLCVAPSGKCLGQTVSAARRRTGTRHTATSVTAQRDAAMARLIATLTKAGATTDYTRFSTAIKPAVMTFHDTYAYSDVTAEGSILTLTRTKTGTKSSNGILFQNNSSHDVYTLDLSKALPSLDTPSPWDNVELKLSTPDYWVKLVFEQEQQDDFLSTAAGVGKAGNSYKKLYMTRDMQFGEQSLPDAQALQRQFNIVINLSRQIAHKSDGKELVAQAAAAAKANQTLTVSSASATSTKSNAPYLRWMYCSAHTAGSTGGNTGDARGVSIRTLPGLFHTDVFLANVGNIYGKPDSSRDAELLRNFLNTAGPFMGDGRDHITSSTCFYAATTENNSHKYVQEALDQELNAGKGDDLYLSKINFAPPAANAPGIEESSGTAQVPEFSSPTTSARDCCEPHKNSVGTQANTTTVKSRTSGGVSAGPRVPVGTTVQNPASCHDMRFVVPLDTKWTSPKKTEVVGYFTNDSISGVTCTWAFHKNGKWTEYGQGYIRAGAVRQGGEQGGVWTVGADSSSMKYACFEGKDPVDVNGHSCNANLVFTGQTMAGTDK